MLQTFTVNRSCIELFVSKFLIQSGGVSHLLNVRHSCNSYGINRNGLITAPPSTYLYCETARLKKAPLVHAARRPKGELTKLLPKPSIIWRNRPGFPRSRKTGNLSPDRKSMEIGASAGLSCLGCIYLGCRPFYWGYWLNLHWLNASTRTTRASRI